MLIWRRRIAGSFFLLTSCLLLSLGALAGCGTEAPAKPSPPRLAVLLVFDQLRGDYLERWQSLFEPDGFRRLQDQGAWFQNCHYPYAHTLTGAGHASLATACSPAKHGIIENDWYDRVRGEPVYCAAVGRYELVPFAPLDETTLEKRKQRAKGSLSPERLLVPTLGESLKEGTQGKGRVVSLSLKDRSAVLLGGRRADACYWLDTNTGAIVTSSYYAQRLPAWLAGYNQSKPADRWFGKDWTRLRPELDYVRYSGPDEVEGEGKGKAQGLTFPHPMTGGLTRPGKEYYEALYNSPQGNELLLDLVKRAISAEQLGGDEAPDLLCVSFSSNDPVGHCWGPDSQEVFDTTLRSDRIVSELLAFLDAQVGKGRYVVALSADHGICPLPEVARARGKDAGRVPPDILIHQAELFLNATFGTRNEKLPWIEAVTDYMVYLNHRFLRHRGLEVSRVQQALADWLKQQPGVQAAYTHSQLRQGVPVDDLLGQSVQRSFHAERSGDILLVPKPYYLFTESLATGTTHGTPHPYDTHVPLLVYGPGVRGGVRKDAVTPQAAAVSVARALGINPPSGAEVPVPEGLFEQP